MKRLFNFSIFTAISTGVIGLWAFVLYAIARLFRLIDPANQLANDIGTAGCILFTLSTLIGLFAAFLHHCIVERARKSLFDD